MSITALCFGAVLAIALYGIVSGVVEQIPGES